MIFFKRLVKLPTLCCAAYDCRRIVLSGFYNAARQFYGRRSIFGLSGWPGFLTAIFFLIFSPFISCKDANDAGASDKINTGDTSFFYPSKTFFLHQVQDVHAGDTVIYISRKNNIITDSVQIDKTQFNRLAYRFIECDISEEAMKIYYRSSVFLDETTGSITFSYNTIDANLPVQSMDILIDRLTQEVKRIFITRIVNNGQETLTEKMGWKANSNFFINTIKSTPGNKEETNEIMVTWRK